MGKKLYGGALIFKGECHARVQNQRIFFHGRTFLGCEKSGGKTRKKYVIFMPYKNTQYGNFFLFCFYLLQIRHCLYDYTIHFARESSYSKCADHSNSIILNE